MRFLSNLALLIFCCFATRLSGAEQERSRLLGQARLLIRTQQEVSRNLETAILNSRPMLLPLPFSLQSRPGSAVQDFNAEQGEFESRVKALTDRHQRLADENARLLEQLHNQSQQQVRHAIVEDPALQREIAGLREIIRGLKAENKDLRDELLREGRPPEPERQHPQRHTQHRRVQHEMIQDPGMRTDNYEDLRPEIQRLASENKALILHIRQREAQLRECEYALRQRDQRITGQEAYIAQLEVGVQNLEGRLLDYEETLRQRDAQLRECEDALAESDQLIDDQERGFRELRRQFRHPQENSEENPGQDSTARLVDLTDPRFLQTILSRIDELERNLRGRRSSRSSNMSESTESDERSSDERFEDLISEGSSDEPRIQVDASTQNLPAADASAQTLPITLESGTMTEGPQEPVENKASTLKNALKIVAGAAAGLAGVAGAAAIKKLLDDANREYNVRPAAQAPEEQEIPPVQTFQPSEAQKPRQRKRSSKFAIFERTAAGDGG